MIIGVIDISVAAAVIASVIAIYKHGSLKAAEASAVKEAAIVKADITAAVSKVEATVATIKADLSKYTS